MLADGDGEKHRDSRGEPRRSKPCLVLHCLPLVTGHRVGESGPDFGATTKEGGDRFRAATLTHRHCTFHTCWTHVGITKAGRPHLHSNGRKEGRREGRRDGQGEEVRRDSRCYTVLGALQAITDNEQSSGAVGGRVAVRSQGGKDDTMPVTGRRRVVQLLVWVDHNAFRMQRV